MLVVRGKQLDFLNELDSITRILFEFNPLKLFLSNISVDEAVADVGSFWPKEDAFCLMHGAVVGIPAIAILNILYVWHLYARAIENGRRHG